MEPEGKTEKNDGEAKRNQREMYAREKKETARETEKCFLFVCFYFFLVRKLVEKIPFQGSKVTAQTENRQKKEEVGFL